MWKPEWYICCFWIASLAFGSMGIVRHGLAQAGGTESKNEAGAFESLEECLIYASENAISIQTSRLEAKIAGQRVKEAKGWLLPEVNGFANFEDYYRLPVQLIPAEVFGGEAGDFVQVQFGTQYNLKAGIDARMPMLNTHHWNEVKSARMKQEQAMGQLAVSIQDLEEHIAEAYFLFLLSKAAVQISEKEYLVNDTLWQKANFRLEQGVIEPLEANRVKNMWLNSQIALAQNEETYERNLLILKVLMGLAPSDEAAFLEDLFDLSANEGVAELSASYQDYPSYAVQMLNVKLAENSLRDTRQARLPELSLVAQWSEQAQRNEFNFFDRGEPWFNIGYVGFQLQVPVFSGFRKNARIDQAGLQMEIARKKQQQWVNETQQQDQELVVRMNRAAKGSELAGQGHELNQENYRIARYKYEKGIFSLDELLNVYQEYLNAQQQYLQQLADFGMLNAKVQIRNRAAAGEVQTTSN